MSEPAAQAPARKRSGSQKRQRSKMLPVYLTADELTVARARASEAGLSASSYGRAVLLGAPGPRARRSPPVNAELFAHAVAQLNKAGSNLNQIARTLNAARAVGARECLQTLDEIRAVLARIRELVGRSERYDRQGNGS